MTKRKGIEPTSSKISQPQLKRMKPEPLFGPVDFNVPRTPSKKTWLFPQQEDAFIEGINKGTPGETPGNNNSPVRLCPKAPAVSELPASAELSEDEKKALPAPLNASVTVAGPVSYKNTSVSEKLEDPKQLKDSAKGSDTSDSEKAATSGSVSLGRSLKLQ